MALANTLTNITNDLNGALDIVQREQVGFIRAVRVNPRDGASGAPTERAAKDQNINYPVWPAATTATLTPAMTAPSAGGVTPTQKQMAISNVKYVAVPWSGEESQELANLGLLPSSNRDRIAQAYRALTADIEADLAALYVEASRAKGTAGTTPFATAADLTDLSGVGQILTDNGAPANDRKIVLDGAATANLKGKHSELFKVNEAGSSELLRRGTISLPILGWDIHESREVKLHTKGTGASYLLNDAASAKGDTTITVDTGTGTILAGDVITFAGTTDAYVVKTALSGTTLAIQNPGLLAGETDNDAITVGGSYRANLAFHRDAVVLLTRLPALPPQGDGASFRTTVVDEFSGLAFDAAYFGGFYQGNLIISIAWGVEVVKPEFVAILRG